MPAIHGKNRSRAIRGRRARQVNRDSYHIFRPADPPQWNGLQEALQIRFILPQRSAELGLDKSWTDYVNADSIRAPLSRHGLRQIDQRRLAGAVQTQHRLGP